MHETFPNIVLENFHFKEVSKDDIGKEIRNLNFKKSSTFGYMRWCLFTVLNRFHQLFFKGEYFP